MIPTLIIICSILVLILIISLIFGYKIFDSSINTKAKEVDPGTTASNDMTLKMEAFFESERKRLMTLNMESVYIRSFDGIKLHGYFKEAKEKTNKTIICVHGYKGTSIHAAPKYASWLTDYNYNILFIDQRGYGLSEGKYTGFGNLESRDLMYWVNYINDRFDDKALICLFGMSLGGNTVLNCADKEGPIKCIISDSGFTVGYQEIKYLVKRKIKFATIFMPIANMFTRIIAKYNLKEADSRKVLAKSKRPVMFIASIVDCFVPSYMSEENYNACTSEKEIHMFKDAPHVRICYYYKEGYKKICLDFLAKYL